jgi:hypothetical protein
LSFNAAEKRNKLAPFHRLFQTQTWVLSGPQQPTKGNDRIQI